jgi:hypothetical protein
MIAFACTVLAGLGAGQARLHRVSRPLHRQGQSGALFLGRSRSCRYSVFGPHRAAAQRRDPKCRCLGHGGSLLARSFELGFWPGNGGYGRAAFYVYAYPEPAGYGDTRLKTGEAFYDKNLGQFILPYDAVRQASNPDALLLGFLQETYEAAADLAKWDRQALERAPSRNQASR